MKKIIFLAIIILGLTIIAGSVYAQNGIIGSGFGTNDWATTDDLAASAGDSRIGTFTANATGDSYLRTVINWSGNSDQYTITNGVDVSVTAESELNPNAGPTTSGAMYLNIGSTSYNYVFKTLDATLTPSHKLIIFEVQGAVRSVSEVAKDKSTIYPGQSVTATATLDGSFYAGQGVYLRYSDDGFTSSTITEMTGSGTSYTASIPGGTNSPSANISYYVFTSGDGLTVSSDNADWYTINLNNNTGSNYSYTVESSWTTKSGATNWSNTASWDSGEVPASEQPVTIEDDLTLDQDVNISQLTINNGVTFTASDVSTRTMTVSNSGTITNNGTFSASDGNVTASGDATVTGTNAITFNNFVTNGGLTLSTVPTINGIMQINNGGFLNQSPNYGNSSTLIYNSEGSYTTSNEWIAGTSGVGVPQNVQISTASTAVSFFGSFARTVLGNLTVDASTSLALSSSSGGDLNIGGNFTDNGTFTHNSRSVTLNGTILQTIGGTANPTAFYSLTITNSVGVQTSDTKVITIGTDGMGDVEVLTINPGAILNIENTDIGTIVIHGTVVIHGTKTIRNGCDIEIRNKLKIMDGATLNINRGGMLTVDGDTDFTGTNSFTIKSDENGTGSFIPKGTVDADVIIERYLTHDRWHYISEPVNDTRLFNAFLDLSGGTDQDQFYWWDEDGSDGSIGIWFDILNNPTGISYTEDSFIAAQGYAINYIDVDETISFVGVPYTANKSITITKTNGSTGEASNLIGNPFSSDIAINNDADGTNNFITKNETALDDLYEAIYLWDEQVGWDGSSNADYIEITNSTVGAKYAPSGQAFFVMAASNGATINFDPLIRKHGSATFYKNTNNDNTTRFELFVKDSENRGNRTTIAFLENMTLGLDPSYDAGKLKGNPNIALYTRLVEDNGIDFAIQALPNDNIESLTVSVGIDVIEATTCEFSVKPDALEGYPIYLQDIQENTVTNLKEENYNTLVTESGTGRFFLHFTDISDINTIQLSEQINIFSANNKVEVRSNKPIDATINIYNIAGQLITTSQLVNESGTSLSIQDYKGVAIVSITTSGQTINEKVIIW